MKAWNSPCFFFTLRLFGFILTLIFGCLEPAWGEQESVLYSFRAGAGDGIAPLDGLVADKSGNLYGTTSGGGANFEGALFELSPPTVAGGHWSETLLFSFGGNSAGAAPAFGSLVFDQFGNLYGTTSVGGLTGSGCSSAGCGTVFELSPPSSQGGSWTHTVIYEFSPGGASYPIGGVVLDASGNLYGTTSSGGTAGWGTVYQLQPPLVAGGPWTEQVLHSFAGGADGASPQASVTIGTKNEIYGSTQGGGSAGFGTVFELIPPAGGGAWKKIVLHNFVGGKDGANPDASVILDSAGNVYGTTVMGGGPTGVGTVFQLMPPSTPGGRWREAVLYAFQSKVGANPYDAPVLDHSGNLYGTTYQGGSYNRGIIFKLAPPAENGGVWTFTTLHEFDGGGDGVDEGIFPFAALIPGADGSLYSTTSEGGRGACQNDIYYGCGTVFRIAP
jgi:uncharacterized repeat protein (TIGR03803 family)